MCKLSGSLYPEDSNSHSQFLHFNISKLGWGWRAGRLPGLGAEGMTQSAYSKLPSRIHLNCPDFIMVRECWAGRGGGQ